MPLDHCAMEGLVDKTTKKAKPEISSIFYCSIRELKKSIWEKDTKKTLQTRLNQGN